MIEELGVEVKIQLLLWRSRTFCDKRAWHELSFCDVKEIPPAFAFKSGEVIHRIEDGGNYLEFKWAPAKCRALSALDIPPISSRKNRDFASLACAILPDGNPAGNDRADRKH